MSISGTGVGGIGALRNISGSNSWSGAITLAASSTIDADAGTLDVEANIVNSTSTATFTNVGTIIFNGALGSGTGAFVKYGTGLLSLGGTNTYTGTTTIYAGTVQCNMAGTLSSASAFTVNTNGTLNLNGFNQTIASLAGTGPGNVTLGSATLTAGAAASTTFAGVIGSTGGLVKTGVGTMTLSGVNTYTGSTTINAGAISIAAATGIGNITNALTLNGGTLIASTALTLARPITLGTNGGTFNETASATLTLSGVISGPGALIKAGTRTLALTGTNTYLGGTTNGAGIITIGFDSALGDSGGAVTFTNSATLTTTASFTSARNIFLNAGTATFSCGTGFTNTFNGVISGAGALTQSGSGVMLLGGNNTFTNLLTISKGIVRLGGNERISDLAPVLVSGGVFDLSGFTETIGSLAGSSGSITLGSGFLTAGGNNLSTTNADVISGTGGFTKAGTGAMILTGANTYTSNTVVAAGTLQIGANERIANTSPLVISNGATFNLTWNGTNYNETVASLAGAGSVILGTGTLTAGNTATANFSGGISGAGAFTKVGTGTQIFSGTNSYTGATTISVGNLQVNGSSSGSAVTIASAATLSGGGTVGTVAVNSGATNSPGTSAPGTLSSGAETWAGGGNYFWEVNNATGAKGTNWDWLNISGALNITATSGSQFNLRIVSLTPANAAGVVTNFNNTLTYVWTIASASGGISGFSAANFNLITSGFQNALGAGTFSLSQSGNDLNLIFTSAAAAAIKGVQSGTLVSTGNGTNTATLGTGVNPTNAFLFFSTRHSSGVPGGSMVRGSITSSNTVNFVRATTETSTLNIQWYVVEYSAGVRVQRGEVNQTNTNINVPITAVSATNQAFVLWSKTPDPAETSFSDSDPVVGEITSTTNLQFRVSSAPSSVPVISWQVVEFQNPASINVQKGSVTNLTGTNLLATATLAAPVVTNNTFLLTGYRTSGSGTSVGARMLRAQLASANSITFDRSIAGAPDDISEIEWQAVQLNDGSVVQSGSVNFANGVAETNVTLTSLNTNRAAAFASVQPAGGQNTGRSPSTGNVLGVGSATLAMTSVSQLTLDRNNTSDQVDLGWQVVGFGPGSLLAPATGGSVISADTTTNTYTGLSGPVYTEIQNGNVGAGTIILTAPAGFVFDTNTVQPAVLITRTGGSGANSLNLNGVASGTFAAMTTVNPTNLIFTVTTASGGGVTCSLTWTNVRVRPTAGTPLASGSIVDTGTAAIQGVTINSTTWGLLGEVVGAATKLAIATQPSAAVIAGADFPVQPVIQVQDQFGNLRTADNTNIITATSSGTDTNDVNGSVTAVGGVAAFSGLDYLIAQTNTITFSAPGLTSKTSSNIVVSAAAASQVTVVTQPSATATAGINFSQQPIVQVQDAYGNLVKTDTSTVSAVIDQGSGNLFGTQSFKAVGGVATFTNLSYQIAETITIDFTDGGLDIDTSTGTTVGAAAASQLVIQTQPSATATAGVVFAQQPAVQIQDQFGNLCATNNSTVVTAARNVGSGSGTLQGALTATASGGVATFANLSHNVATTISVDFNSGTLTNTTSIGISISPAAVSKLAFATQPGAATVGLIFGTQPALVTQDVFGNNSVSGLANSLSVSMALTSGSGTLLGTTNLDIGTAAGNGTVAFANLEIDFVGSKQLTASASGLANAVSSSFSVAQGGTSVAVVSSKNPSGFKDNVIFTASVPTNATGSLIFLTNGVALSTNSLSFGSAASTATILLPRGTNTITVQYAGDTNYIGSTNILSGGQIVTNHPPSASVMNVLRTAGLTMHILLADVATNWSDADVDAVSLAGINLLTTNSINLLTNATQILYTNGPNVNDQITYLIKDGQGGTNTGVINVVINPFVTGQQSGAVSIAGSSATVQFYGIPGYIYVTQRTTNLVSWASIATNTVPISGVISVTDTFGDLGVVPTSAYYRLRWSP